MIPQNKDEEAGDSLSQETITGLLEKVKEATFLLNNYFLPKGGMCLCQIEDPPSLVFKWKYVENYKQLALSPKPESFANLEAGKNEIRLRMIEQRLLPYFNEALREAKLQGNMDCDFLFSDHVNKGPLILNSISMVLYKRDIDEEELSSIEAILRKAHTEENLRREHDNPTEERERNSESF